MILKITGCDCSGKSTLVKALSEKLNWDNIHFDKPKNYEDGKKQYFDFAEKMNMNPSINIICDRLEEGEWIYAPLYRNYKGDYLQEFEKEITRVHDYLMVYVKADLEVILERARVRGEDFVKEDDFSKVLDNFDKYLSEQQLPYIIIDTSDSKTEEDVNKILNAINKAKDIWSKIRNGEIVSTKIKL